MKKNKMGKKVTKHLKKDIKEQKHGIKEDKELMKSIKDAHKEHHSSKKKGKVSKVMHEFAEGKLHSGSKKGPKVTNRKQALAISLSEARKAGEKVKPVKKRRK